MVDEHARRAPAGTQVVQRVGALLRALTAARDAGARLPEIAAATGLTRPTAHRLLTALAADGLAEQDARDGRWFLGLEAVVMGNVAAARFPIEELARPSVRRLAEATGESAFLSMRRGGETVCLLREEGAFPLRSFVLMEGTRFPLGIGSAGLAILAHLREDERAELVAALELGPGSPWGPGQSAEAIRATVADAERSGWVVNPGRVVEGSWGMGAAVFDRRGRPMWALSITGVEARFRPERQPELGHLLLREAHLVSRRLASAGTAPARAR